jgi:hypothetical protein
MKEVRETHTSHLGGVSGQSANGGVLHTQCLPLRGISDRWTAPFLEKVFPEPLTIIDRGVRLQERGVFPIYERWLLNGVPSLFDRSRLTGRADANHCDSKSGPCSDGHHDRLHPRT